MKQKMFACLLAGGILFGALAGCGAKQENTAEPAVQASAEEATSEAAADSLVTIDDVFAANSLENVFADHTSVATSTQWIPSDSGEILFQFNDYVGKTADGTFEQVYESASDGDITLGLERNSCMVMVMYYSDEDACRTEICPPEDLNSYVWDVLYQPFFSNMEEYHDLSNEMQDDALVVSAETETKSGDILETLYLFVNPDTLELYAMNEVYSYADSSDPGVSINKSFSYDGERPTSTTYDDLLAMDSPATVTIHDTISGKDYTCEVPGKSNVCFTQNNQILGLYTDATLAQQSVSDDHIGNFYTTTPGETVELYAAEEENEEDTSWTYPADADEAALESGLILNFPEDAKDVCYRVHTADLDGDGEDEKMLEMSYDDEDDNWFTVRALPTAEAQDISEADDMELSWDSEEVQTVNGMEATLKSYRDTEVGNAIYLVTWYDSEAGISYSALVMGFALDDFDPIGYAEEVYQPMLEIG